MGFGKRPKCGRDKRAIKEGPVTVTIREGHGSVIGAYQRRQECERSGGSCYEASKDYSACSHNYRIIALKWSCLEDPL